MNSGNTNSINQTHQTNTYPLGTRNKVPETVTTQTPEESWNCLTVKMGVSQFRIMTDKTIIKIEHSHLRIRFHGEPPLTNHHHQAPIKQPCQENHPNAVTTANMVEEQSKNQDSIAPEEHNRPDEILNPPKRARTDDHDTTQVGVSEGSVTLVGPGLINNGLIATLSNEADMFSSSEEEDAEMDDGTVL